MLIVLVIISDDDDDKGKVIPVLWLSTTPWRCIGEWRYSSTYSLTSALDGGEWSASRPGRFSPSERAPGIRWTGGWVGPRAVLDAVVKRKIPSPRRESNLRTPIVQPVAQHDDDDDDDDKVIRWRTLCFNKISRSAS
jgi:hypothetical protein